MTKGLKQYTRKDLFNTKGRNEEIEGKKHVTYRKLVASQQM